ncbi:acetyl-CoA synthetase-like protein [Aspergillus avenaceus]|uniref:Acetyl-CoA synthetase-like protein n=1 Tax=Aspergillus avenaceus TaxID=36643 RepID=A0A5N6TXT3_ASPAV|nr:acetyl-CoA synthetase-like protein [Aspergillus avenaceus]
MAELPLAWVEGEIDHPLTHLTLGQLLHQRAEQFGDKVIAVFFSQGVRISYTHLLHRGIRVSRALRNVGLKYKDCVGIMAGNCLEYLEIFVGAALIGCSVLPLNTMYGAWEVQNAIKKSCCRLLFLSVTIGSRRLDEYFEFLDSPVVRSSLPDLAQVITIGDRPNVSNTTIYEDFLAFSCDIDLPSHSVDPSDILSLQLTSGTSGEAKISMLTHLNLLNNAYFIGQALCLSADDILCCPPPLFHSFGLGLGFLATLIHGGTIVLPSDHFNAGLTLDSIAIEHCTTVYGTPTMFLAELEANATQQRLLTTLQKGLVGASPVPPSLMDRLKEGMGIPVMLVAYGMTETSPVTFTTRLRDNAARRATTVGQVMPHTGAKIVDQQGRTLHRGERGELCISGYALHRGYFNNKAKTDEVMREDDNRVTWLYTGNEAILDQEGYCHILGRTKDIIIRGGENLFPAEIESCLLKHPSINDASVVGVPDPKYGEAVACFLQALADCAHPDDKEMKQWVTMRMHKSISPQHIFWVGTGGICLDFPKTGSGKHHKGIMKDMASQSLQPMICLFTGKRPAHSKEAAITQG